MGESMYYCAVQLSITVAIESIDKITDNTKFEELKVELFNNIVAVIHLAGDIYPRLKHCGSWESVLNTTEREFLLAFAYLNNQIKHDMDLQLFHYEVYGSSFPLKFPFHFGPPCLAWSSFPDHGNSRKAKREYYDKYLKHKDVKTSLKMLNRIFERCRETH